MVKKSSIAFSIIGVVLVVVAIVWWAVLAPTLTKLPKDIDIAMDFEGQLTQYVDSATGQPLPPGEELAIPLTVHRTFVSVSDLATSSMLVCDDSIMMNLAGQERPAQVTRYALDRKTRKCVESDENWAYTPMIVLNDRVGHYGPIFPGGLKVGDTVSAFFNDPAKAFEVKVAEKIDNYNGLGITALKIDASRPSTAYYDPIAQAVLGSMGLPMEITFDELTAQMKAAGLDLGALLGALAAVMAPEDLQALQALTSQPVKLIYMQESGDVIYIEAKTGATVGATFDRTTTMEMDSTNLMQAFGIIAKYADDPTAGPMIAGLMGAADQLGDAATRNVFNQNMSIIPASEASLADEAKTKASLLGWVDIGIPVIVVVVGAILLVLGVYLFARSRKSKAPAPTSPTEA